MNKAILIILISLTCIQAQSDPLTSEKIFKDSEGHQWKRWIIKEAQEENHFLLIIDEPLINSDSSELTQQLIYRKTFNKLQAEDFKNKLSYYADFSDLKVTPKKPYALSPFEVKSPIWKPVKNNWTLEDEKKYAEWFSSQVDENYFKNSGIIFDCADFGLLSRWVFAHDNKLPVANTLAGTGKLMGHWSTQSGWENLPTHSDWRKDQRFIAAIRYLMNNTYTHFIFKDLYPVEISRQFVTPGSVLLVLYSPKTGHTQLVKTLGYDRVACGSLECISVLYGDLPAKDISYRDQAWIVNGGEQKGGFMRWRWPLLSSGQWKLTAPNKMPGYSLEQYFFPNISGSEYEEYIYSKLNLQKTDKDLFLLALYKTSSHLWLRKKIVNEGYIICGLQYCPTDSLAYDSYSTPNADRQFSELRKKVLTLLKNIDPADVDIANEIKWLSDLPFIGGTNITTYDYIFNVNNISDKMSADPNQNYLTRWGLTEDNITSKIFLYQWLWSSQWQERAYKAVDGSNFCKNKPDQCLPGTDAYKQYETRSFDNGMKLLTSITQETYAFLSEVQKQESDITAKKVAYYDIKYCPWNEDSKCNQYDFLFSGSEYMNKITSDPRDDLRKRFGF